MSESQICDPQGNPVELEELEETTEVTDTPQPEPDENPEAPEMETRALPEMKCGYVVGVQPNGEFVFEVIGTDPSNSLVMGLHRFAEHRINLALDLGHGGGLAVLAHKLERVDQMLQVVLNMMTQDQKRSLLK